MQESLCFLLLKCVFFVCLGNQGHAGQGSDLPLYDQLLRELSG